MPVITNFSMAAGSDQAVTFYLTPAQPVGGWSVQYALAPRNGGSPMWTATLVSGQTNGASGLTVLNSGQGWFQLTLTGGSGGISGLVPGTYAGVLSRTDSGLARILAESILMVTP